MILRSLILQGRIKTSNEDREIYGRKLPQRFGREVNSLHYSVLMSVYDKEKPEFFKQSMDSIFAQTVRPDDFVIVCDGPLTAELDAILEAGLSEHGDMLRIVRLEQNRGLGKALNEGIVYCRNELIARMDSDDIARPDRCEKQLRVFEEDAEVGICSGIIEEFIDVPGDEDSRRVPPENQKEIKEFSRLRNPFNHPCVMYKKSAVQAAGGYMDFYLLEDYYLWIRMIRNGVKGYNIQEPLLWMRAGNKLYMRRAGWKYAVSQIKLFLYMYRVKYLSFSKMAYSIAVRLVSALLPNFARRIVYMKMLREKAK